MTTPPVSTAVPCATSFATAEGASTTIFGVVKYPAPAFVIDVPVTASPVILVDIVACTGVTSPGAIVIIGIAMYPHPAFVIVKLSTCPPVTLACITACVACGGALTVIVGAIS